MPRKGGPGRPPGMPNKDTKELREMILMALDRKGGVEYLAQQADENPASFMTLLGKVLPLQVTGKDGENMKFQLCLEVPPLPHAPDKPAR